MTKYFDLMNILSEIPLEFHSLPFHLWGITSEIIIKYETIDVSIIHGDNNKQFGFKLCDDELYGQVYINKIKDKSVVKKAFKKATCDLINSKILLSLILMCFNVCVVRVLTPVLCTVNSPKPQSPILMGGITLSYTYKLKYYNLLNYSILNAVSRLYTR